METRRRRGREASQPGEARHQGPSGAGPVWPLSFISHFSLCASALRASPR